MKDYGLIGIEEDQEHIQEDNEDENQEDIEDDIDEEDYEEDDDYDEEEGVEELMLMRTMPSRVLSSISDGRALQKATEVVINNDSNECEGNQEHDCKEDVCPICLEAWSSGGDHQICCLPCGHIYGLSCINKWLQQRRGAGKCPQCNNLCTLKDVRVLYATRLCVVDQELLKRMRPLEARCAYLE